MTDRDQQIADSAELRPSCLAWRGWDTCWLIAIFAAALTLRLIYVLQLQSCPYFSDPVMDPGCHHEWAKAIIAGEDFWNGPFFRAPLYAWFLALIYQIFGPENQMAPRVVQAVLGSLSCCLLFMIGRRFFSRSAGVIAGLAAASYWIFLYYDAELLIPVLIIFLDLLLLWLLLETQDRRKPLMWVACGLLLGLSAIARPNILLLAPALVAWLFVLHRPNWLRALAYSFCLFIGSIAPVAPVTIYNYVVGHDRVLIATQGGVNFYIGNNEHSDGMSAIVKGDPAQWRECFEAQINRAEAAEGRKLKPSEVSQWYFRQSLRFMRDKPAAAATLLLKKLSYFWSYWEVSNNQDIRFITSHYTPIVRWLPLGFGVVAPLGVLGLLLTFRRAKRLFPLWGFVLIYMLSVVFFFVTARFRVPVVVVLILLAGHAVCWLSGVLRRKQWKSLGLSALVLIAMGLVASRRPPKVDVLMLQEHKETGISLMHKERFVESERLLSELVKRSNSVNRKIDAESWYWLGYARLKLEKTGEAVECFKNALAMKSDYPEARGMLGVALAAIGEYDEAIDQFERVVRDDPENPTAHANLSSALARARRMEEATSNAVRAVELDPSSGAKIVETAMFLQQQLRVADALALLRACAAKAPSDLPLTIALIQMLTQQSSVAAQVEAVELAERACEQTRRRDPAVLHAAASAWFVDGQLKKAVAAEREAAQLAAQQNHPDLLRRCQEALRRYEAAAGISAPPSRGP